MCQVISDPKSLYMPSHYRCWVTKGAKKRKDVEQDRVTIGAKWDKNPICVEHQQSVSVE